MFDIHCFTKNSFNDYFSCLGKMIYSIGIPCVLHIAETKKYIQDVALGLENTLTGETEHRTWTGSQVANIETYRQMVSGEERF